MRAYIEIFPLLCFQCISAQCIGSRIYELPAFSNIPVEYLAMGNYGAMDFLPASDYYLTPNMLPMIPIPSVKEEIYGDRFNPYAIEPLNLEFSSPFGPYSENQASPFLAKPTGFSLPLEVSLTSTCPYKEQYSFNPFGFPTPSLYPAAVTSPSVVEVLSPFAYPASSAAVISTPIGEVLNPFTNSAPFAAVSPSGFNLPLAFETPALVNPYTTSLWTYEAPCVTNLPNYIAPLSTWAEPAAIEIPNFVPSSSGFTSRISELLRSFTPRMNIKCLSGSGPSALAASKGREFLVTSSSSIRPTGISIASENVYQGLVSVAGRLPFLGTVGFDGTLPSFGSGAVNYRCGSGNVAILSEESSISEGYPYLDTQYF